MRLYIPIGLFVACLNVRIMKTKKQDPLDMMNDVMRLMFWGEPVKEKKKNNE
jgi:hypothetical protein